jgi:predicted dehydrogenase
LTVNPLRVVIIGFGNIAANYSNDYLMEKHYPFSTHAQVLSVHPKFNWDSVVDVSSIALDMASHKWGVSYCSLLCENIHSPETVDILIIATPPEERSKYLQLFPNLKAVIVEKPISSNILESKKFIDICKERKILAQVNYLRRADTMMQKLAHGELEQMIGDIQTGTILYGNGILNNGSHMIDLIRMLVSEVSDVQVIMSEHSFFEGPVENDLNLHCLLHLTSGACINMVPLRFSEYRENSIELWGTKGKLCIYQEGLLMHFYPKSENRAMLNEWEISSDKVEIKRTGIGHALYDLYDDISKSLDTNESLCSSAESALINELVIDNIFLSLKNNGEVVSCYE